MRTNQNQTETFVRADGAFIPFSDDIDISHITTSVKGVGQIGSVKKIDLQSPIASLIGRQVLKVGRSSGLTSGTVMSYALEYNDEKGICFFTDFLVVGENQQTFDLEGDSGSLILLKGGEDQMPQPIGNCQLPIAIHSFIHLKIQLTTSLYNNTLSIINRYYLGRYSK